MPISVIAGMGTNLMAAHMDGAHHCSHARIFQADTVIYFVVCFFGDKIESHLIANFLIFIHDPVNCRAIGIVGITSESDCEMVFNRDWDVAYRFFSHCFSNQSFAKPVK